MDNRLKLLVTTGMGAAAMYFFDPERGRYRRALVRNQLVHAGHKSKRGLRVVGRDTRNRALGTTATLRSYFDFEQPDDSVLVERVRACLGRAVSHPHSIDVEANDGVITLSGPILEREVPLLIDCVLGVGGVEDVRDRLEVHAEPGRVPGLQGTPRQQPGARSAFMQTNWSPTARAAGGLGGALAALYGFNRRNPGGTLLGTAGMILLGRATSNLELRRLFGIGGPRHAVEIQKNIRIHAPVEQVFALWDDFENFPQFMTHVRHVRPLETGADSLWRWTVSGPTGTQFEFDAVVTAREENRLLAWRTESGALIQHAGRVHFQDNSDGTTTIDIKMVYNPVAGAVGHAIARLLGADPKHQMDDDLMRMKSFIETGKAPHDAAERAGEPPRAPHEQTQPKRAFDNGSRVAQ
ncbi:MAG: SRPBCC family protein [Gammaproteobacteria bacterium]